MNCCQDYLISITSSSSNSIARQIYFYLETDIYSVTGLYVAPSDDTSNVFYKYNWWMEHEW